MDLYEVAFHGQLVEGAQPEAVKANLARLFQADAQRIALLFSGRRIVIKNNLDAAGAQKYRVTLERAGALVDIAPMPMASQAPRADAASPGEKAPGRLQVAPRDEYMAAFRDVQAPDFGVAALGADLQDRKPAAAPPSVDLSRFSLAPVGSDMGQAPGVPAAPAPDTSHLRLQE